MYRISTLDNGLRIVTVSMPHAYSISMGLYLAVGSRYEDDRVAGASHFIEHMLFKGTQRRSTPRDIALAIEGVGGDINASTGREMTTYYARVSRDDLAIVSDVLVDMLRQSRFNSRDIERERQVIIEEINESLDSPDDLVYMQFQKMLWPTHPLGRDVAGSRESVRQLDRSRLLEYMAGHYVPKHTVISVAGAVTHEQVCELVGPMLADWEGESKREWHLATEVQSPSVRILPRPIEQTHLLLGVPSYSRTDERQFALSLMNIILGGGMSSRLFVNIREELGLAYSVYSYSNALFETGAFAVYAGVESRNVKATLHAILEQLHRLRSELVSEEELAMAKAYARGRTLLRLEDSGANAGWVGSQLILTNEIKTPEDALASIDAVTREAILETAQDLFRDKALALSLVGPIDKEERFSSLLRVE